MAELKKRVGSLKRELEAAQDMKPAELAGVRRNFISQDIVTATSQIEKIVLTSQLARLSVQGPKQPKGADAAAQGAKPGDSGQPQAVKDAPEAADVNTEKQPAVDATAKRAAQGEPPSAAQPLGESGRAPHQPAWPTHGHATHSVYHMHRHGPSAVAGAVASTYREAGQNVRQIDLKA